MKKFFKHEVSRRRPASVVPIPPMHSSECPPTSDLPRRSSAQGSMSSSAVGCDDNDEPSLAPNGESGKEIQTPPAVEFGVNGTSRLVLML